MHVMPTMKADLTWWVEHADTVCRKIVRVTPQIQLFSDSSKAAWGGTCDAASTGGPWVGQELGWHINAKELQAAFFTLKAFCSQVTNSHVRLNIENTTSQ